MEVLYHIRPYFDIFCGYIPLHRPEKLALYMVGTSNQSVPKMAIEKLNVFPSPRPAQVSNFHVASTRRKNQKMGQIHRNS